MIARQHRRVELIRFGILLLPAIVHAVTTREVGTMSLLGPGGPDAARRSRRRVADALDIEPEQLVCAQQVHGDRVIRIGRDARARGAGSRNQAMPDADALITDEPHVFPMLLFADCVPILIVDPRRPAVGLAHAGWKGTSLAISARTVEAMERELGSQPDELRVAIGPAIGRCCYEVSDEVATAVGTTVPGVAVATPGPRGRPHLDLAAANRAQLLAAGVRPENVELSDACTSCRVDRFFSHRAEHGQAGRHAVLLGLRT